MTSLDITLVINDQKVASYLREHLAGIHICNKPREQQDILLYWNDSLAGSSSYALNPPKARQRVDQEEECGRILGINGIKTPKTLMSGQVSRIKRRYKVDVFDLNVLRVMVKKNKNEPAVVVNSYKEKTTRKVCSTAILTLYCLGLDFGAVYIGITSENKKVILGIDASPYLSAKMARYYGTYMHDSLQQLEREITFSRGKHNVSFIPHIMFGADPEFMLYNNLAKRWLIASDYFSKQGVVGTDARPIHTPRHGYPLAELRPTPSSNPVNLVENIRRTMAVGLRKVPCRNVAWVAGSMPMKNFPTGGHIHFSGTKPNTRLIRALDNYLSLPLLMVENRKKSAERRRRYGMLGDFRLKSHGGFEYRTPPSWLVSQEMATAVMCLAALVVKNYPLLRNRYLEGSEAQKHFYMCDKEVFKDNVRDLWQDIILTPDFSNYKQYLKVLEDLIDKGEEWKERVDVRRTWSMAIPRRDCFYV